MNTGISKTTCSCEGLQTESDSITKMIQSLDFSTCPLPALQIIFALLNENRGLEQRILKLTESHQESELRLTQIQSDLIRAMNSRVFSSRKFLSDWISCNHQEIEKGMVLLQRNYPRSSMKGPGKSQVDFLFQDSQNVHLLAEMIWWDEGFEEDCLNKVFLLDKTATVLSQELALPLFKIRKMLITNHNAWGIEDICTINSIEFVWVQSMFQLNKKER